MISGEQIAHYIQSPEEIKQADLSDLKELTIKYPYSSTLHLLYLKGLALNSHLDFESTLKKTAAHSHDRAHLYTVVHSSGAQKYTDDSEVKETVMVDDKIPDEFETSATSESSQSFSEEQANQPPLETAEPANTQTRTIDSEPEQETKAEAEPKSTLNDLVPEEKEPDAVAVDILNTAIDVAYVNSGISKQNEPENVKQEGENDAAAHESQPQKKEPAPLVDLADSDTISPVKKDEIDVSKLSFVEWLKWKKQRETEQPKTASVGDKKNIENPVSKVPLVTKATSVDELLDKFIADEPKISRPVKDFYNPVKSAKQSVEESDDLVTETLAKIYVLQKNYRKAISAYEKLILLNPEKKTFFASQIEKIKNELN